MFLRYRYLVSCLKKVYSNGKLFSGENQVNRKIILFTESILLTDSIPLTENCVEGTGKPEKYPVAEFKEFERRFKFKPWLKLVGST